MFCYICICSHLYNIFTFNVVILNEFLNVNQVCSSLSRSADLSSLTEQRIHLSFKIDDVLFAKPTIDKTSFVIRFHKVIHYISGMRFIE